VFLAATQNIPRYDPCYSFERTTHVRTARLGLIGTPVQKILDSLLPQWQDAVAISLLMDVSLRWYGENRLRVYPLHVREQLRRAYHAFLNVPS
jgi:hypothetical protein